MFLSHFSVTIWLQYAINTLKDNWYLYILHLNPFYSPFSPPQPVSRPQITFPTQILSPCFVSVANKLVPNDSGITDGFHRRPWINILLSLMLWLNVNCFSCFSLFLLVFVGRKIKKQNKNKNFCIIVPLSFFVFLHISWGILFHSILFLFLKYNFLSNNSECTR